MYHIEKYQNLVLRRKSKLKNDIFQQQSVIDFSGCANWMDRYNFRRPPHTGYNLQ